MTHGALHVMDCEDHVLQERLSRFLRRQYETDHACQLARDLDCDVRTAKNALNNFWPRAKTWRQIVRRFGRDVLDAVYAPDIDAVTARLSEELRALEEQAEHRRAMLRQAEGRLARSPRGVGAAASDRAAVGQRRGRR